MINKFMQLFNACRHEQLSLCMALDYHREVGWTLVIVDDGEDFIFDSDDMNLDCLCARGFLNLSAYCYEHEELENIPDNL